MTKVSFQTSQETAPPMAAQPTLRRCLVTGELKPKSELLRFVLDPENNVTPDLAGRLPGRGLWVLADRAALEQAITKNLFSRAAKKKVLVNAGLLAQVETLLTRRIQDLLGLARTAGAAVIREPLVLETLAAGALDAVLLASDAGSDISKKLSRAPVLYRALSRESLGAAFGREHVVAVGLRAHPLTEKIQNELRRWHGVSAEADKI